MMMAYESICVVDDERKHIAYASMGRELMH